MLSALSELERRLVAERATIASWEVWADEVERVLAEDRSSGSWWDRLRGR